MSMSLEAPIQVEGLSLSGMELTEGEVATYYRSDNCQKLIQRSLR
ncbi:MAG: hypothetical protein ACI935_002976 [Moritella dasanensis]|jgi:hypothetical protein